MNETIKEYKKIFKKIFSEYKLLLILLGAVCLLGYGLTITHHSIGVDNNAHDLYYVKLGVLSLGRLTPLILDKVFGAYQYSPFWSNGMSVIVLFFSAISWCVLFIKISKEKISQGALIIFSTVLVSYPIINEHFIFNPLNYALSYGLTALVLMAVYEAFIQKKFSLYALATIIMFFVISLNESFAAVYLCGMLFIAIIKYAFIELKIERFLIFKFFMVASGALLASIILEAILLKVINMFITAEVFVGAANQKIYWFDAPLLSTLKNLLYGIAYKYIYMGMSYFPITVFVIAGIISLIMTIFVAIKKKKPVILLLMFLVYLSIISLNLVTGIFLPYRACSTLGIFVAFVFMLLWTLFKNKWIKLFYGILIIVLVVNQTRVLSDWFYNDYKRYKNDKEIMIQISHDIEENLDKSKPVMFIGQVRDYPNIKRIDGEYNGVSFIDNYADKRESRNYFYYLLHDFFKLHGHSFNIATEEQYLSGRIIAENMPSYPKKGYIKEMDDYIIVNFN